MKSTEEKELELIVLRAEMNSISWWHSIYLGPDLGFTPGREPNSRSRDTYMKIPWDQIKGKTVIDIGAWDGLYSFEALKAGAYSVISCDEYYVSDKGRGITFAADVLGLEYPTHQIENFDVETSAEDPLDLTRKCSNSQADVVFFFGVLYHLKNPYLALQNIFLILSPGGLLILETALMIQCNPIGLPDITPLLEFCPGERDGDPTNWNYPNESWVQAALESIGFIDVVCTGGSGSRAAWHACKPAKNE